MTDQEPTDFICVLRTGGRYGPAHAAALCAAARRHAPGLGRLIALSDAAIDAEGVTHVPLRHDWPGWWAKLEAFRPDLGDAPRLLCDLDTILSGPFAALAGPGLATLEDFFHKGRVSTALMRWRGAALGFLYDEFRADPQRWMAKGSCGDAPNAVHGDQVVVDHLLRRRGLRPDFLQRLHPDLINFYDAATGVCAPVTIFMGPVKPRLDAHGALRPPDGERRIA
jgi:hypothetical protein